MASEDDLPFASRRSPVFGTRGMVATSQPLASEAGMRVLQAGGTAADACVAAAAALNVTEPCSTGIGGDAFCLYYNAKTRKVSALLGNGAAPQALTLEVVRARGIKGPALPPRGALTVTVPGSAALWEDANKSFGKLPLAQVLQPAIELAERGFPVSPVAAYWWAQDEEQLRELEHHKSGGAEAAPAFLTRDGAAPAAGQLHRNPDLARTFRALAEHGAHAGFYTGRIGEAVVAAVRARGGVLSAHDLAAHATEAAEPLRTMYRGHAVFELPPPTAGMIPLMALNLLELESEVGRHPWGSPEHLHPAIEALRAAFADGLAFTADARAVPVPVEELLDKGYAAARRKEAYNPSRASEMRPGRPVPEGPAGEARPGGDTVFLCAVDGEGNACSFINSNYMGFGTGIVPEGCGFSLQNRGYGFTLDSRMPNCLAPGKRPYHTIIPGLALDPQGDLFAAFGVMGAYQQPQGHLQVLSNMIDYGYEPQRALDAPRFSIQGPNASVGPSSALHSRVLLERGFPTATAEGLHAMGHSVQADVKGHDRAVFGRGQIIRRIPSSGVLWGGSDPRSDGQVLGW